MVGTIDAEVIRVIRSIKDCPRKKIRPDSDLVMDLNFHSFDTVELEAGLAEKFKLEKIPDRVTETIRTVGSIVGYIFRELVNKGERPIVSSQYRPYIDQS